MLYNLLLNYFIMSLSNMSHQITGQTKIIISLIVLHLFPFRTVFDLHFSKYFITILVLQTTPRPHLDYTKFFQM